MRYLSIALYAEGPTDYYFLRPLLLRLCVDVCLNDGGQIVEVNEDVFSLDDDDGVKAMPRYFRILDAAEKASEAWNVLFIHSDGGGDGGAARDACVVPAIREVKRKFPDNGCVAIVPIRETEAWALADGEAIRNVFGTTLSDRDLGLPPVSQVESQRDPKKVLNDALVVTKPPSRRRRKGVSPMLNLLGECVNLDVLRGIPSFALLDNELREELRRIRYI